MQYPSPTYYLLSTKRRYIVFVTPQNQEPSHTVNTQITAEIITLTWRQPRYLSSKLTAHRLDHRFPIPGKGASFSVFPPTSATSVKPYEPPVNINYTRSGLIAFYVVRATSANFGLRASNTNFSA